MVFYATTRNTVAQARLLSIDCILQAGWVCCMTAVCTTAIPNNNVVPAMLLAGVLAAWGASAGSRKSCRNMRMDRFRRGCGYWCSDCGIPPWFFLRIALGVLFLHSLCRGSLSVSILCSIGRLSSLEGQRSDKEIVKKKFGQDGGFSHREGAWFGISDCGFYRFDCEWW